VIIVPNKATFYIVNIGTMWLMQIEAPSNGLKFKQYPVNDANFAASVERADALVAGNRGKSWDEAKLPDSLVD